MICITDCRIPRDCLTSLRTMNVDTVLLPPDPALPSPVESHTDLLIFILDDTLLTRAEYYNIAKNEIDQICRRASLSLRLSARKGAYRYPDDCSLCAAVSGDFVICRRNSADESLLALCAEHQKRIISVRQGYAKCSCAVLADGSVITADAGIAHKLTLSGIDVLLISPGGVTLPGYNTGFIGGASGLCGNTLYFAGNILSHPDHISIFDFAESHHTNLVSLSKGALYDVGSMIFIE